MQVSKTIEVVASPLASGKNNPTFLSRLGGGARDLAHSLDPQLGQGNNLTGFIDFNLEARAKIQPWLSYMCHVRPTENGWGARDLAHGLDAQLGLPPECLVGLRRVRVAARFDSIDLIDRLTTI